MKKVALLFLCLTILTGFGSCMDLKKLAGKPPDPDFCNIFLTDSPHEEAETFLVCLNKKSNKEYMVHGVHVERYFALRIQDLVEVITWIRKIEVILDSSQIAMAPYQGEIYTTDRPEIYTQKRNVVVQYLRKIRVKLSSDLDVLQTREKPQL